MILLFGTPSISELLLIVVLILIFFGGRKIPGIMRNFGQGINEFNKGRKGNANHEKKDEQKKQ